MWSMSLLDKTSAAHCFPGYDLCKHVPVFPKCRSVEEIWKYKIGKNCLDPNLIRTPPSVYICSAGMQEDQVASEKVLLLFAYIAGFSITLDTGNMQLIPLRGIKLQTTRRRYHIPIFLLSVN